MEAPCTCSLTGGPATALDVMTRRGPFACAVARLAPSRTLRRAADAVTPLVCAAAEIDTDRGPLGPWDVLVVPPGARVGVASRVAAARAAVVSPGPMGRRPPV